MHKEAKSNEDDKDLRERDKYVRLAPPSDILIQSSNQKVNSWPTKGLWDYSSTKATKVWSGQSPWQLLIILNMISGYLHLL